MLGLEDDKSPFLFLIPGSFEKGRHSLENSGDLLLITWVKITCQTSEPGRVFSITKPGFGNIWVFPIIMIPNDTPKSSHFNRGFHYKPSILGTPIFGNTYIPVFEHIS